MKLYVKRMMDQNPVLVSVVMLVLGLMLLFFPGFALNSLVRIVGIALLAISGISLIGWLRKRDSAESTYEQLAGSVVGLIIALFLLLNPSAVASLFPLLVGAVILVNGCINLLKALDLKKMGYGSWKVPLLLAVLTVIAGITVCANPFSVMKTLIRIAGIVLIYSGASSIWINTRK